jgi:cephalosporin-C deacetylase-like acetyl esterase
MKRLVSATFAITFALAERVNMPHLTWDLFNDYKKRHKNVLMFKYEPNEASDVFASTQLFEFLKPIHKAKPEIKFALVDLSTGPNMFD